MSIQTPTADDAAAESAESQLSVSKDDLFHLLQNSRRRAVLRYFAAHPDREEFDMRTIAEAIAAWENETTVEQLSSDQRQRVYIALYQSHLPKLDEYGVIEYNQSRGRIVPTALIAVFEPYLGETFDEAPLDQRITVPEDRSSFGSAVRSLLHR
ncbi:MAG: hypothetical protein QXG03_10915 [Halalkalicoccus sp.]